MKRRTRVVVVGAGFGGLACAQALAGRDEIEVLVIDRTNHHLFQPLLYQVATAGLAAPDIAAPVRSILASQQNAQVLLAEVTAVDLANKTLRTNAEPAELEYDFLVLALGSKTSYFGHDEWERYAPGLKTIEDAMEIRTRVLLAFERAEVEPDAEERKRLLTFVVIGGGPTGVELSGSIAELAHKVLASDFRAIRSRDAHVVLVEGAPAVLGNFGPRLAQSAREQLQELGVEVRTDARVEQISDGEVVLSDGTHLGARTVVWAAGVRGTRLAGEIGAAHDRSGRVVVGLDCSVDGRRDVFALGDMAHFVPEGDANALPGVSPVAMQQGRYVAAQIVRELSQPGAQRSPFRYRDKGQMATIGRSRAIARAGGIELSGPLAWLAWLFVHLWFLVGFNNRFIVFFNWVWQYVSFKRGARVVATRKSELDPLHARELGTALAPRSVPAQTARVAPAPPPS